MMKVTRNPAIVTTNPNLPTIVASDDAPLIASFPEFQFAVHPEYLVNDGFNAIERAQGGMCTSNASTPGEILTGTFPNGAPAFDMKAMIGDGIGQQARAVGPTSVSLNEFTVIFAVSVRYTGGSLTGVWDVFAQGSASGRVIINTSRLFSIYNGSTPIVQDTALPLSSDVVLVATYSDAEGAKLFRGTELRNSAPGPVSWLVNPISPQAIQPTTNHFTNTDSAVQSALYVTGRDLSKAENFTEFASIVDFMERTYFG